MATVWKKIELGITWAEIIAMLPDIVAEAWGSYSPDKKISADEAVMLLGFIAGKMAAAADDPLVAAFLVQQGEAFGALAPLLMDPE